VTARANRWHCSHCDREDPTGTLRYVCDCPAAGRLELRLADHFRALAAPDDVILTTERSLWRYSALLPVDARSAGAQRLLAGFRPGWTPLTRAGRLAGSLGIAELWVKDEGVNPSGSLKDRASAVALAAAIDLGQRVVATASSGNAGTALAAAAHVAGIACVIFVPSRVPGKRVLQLGAQGAHVVIVDGDYEAAVRLSVAACDMFGWYCRTTAINPYTGQGKKTVALEIAEQLGWRAPDVVVVPVGDGNILVGVYQGFRDARRLGWIDRMPQLVGVQAAGAPALYQAWRSGASRVKPVAANTIADGIAVSAPLDGDRALAALRDTCGLAVTVTDAEIADAVTVLAKLDDVITEPASAAGLAGLRKLAREGAIGSRESVVVVNTGRGYSSTCASEPGPPAVRVPCDLGAVSEALKPITTVCAEQREPEQRLGPRMGWTVPGM
jgi:threonine synthase